MYAIAGVSGKTGSVVADALLQAGKRVRVIVRDPARGAPWRSRGAEVAIASLDDAPALARALAGAEGAYLISPQDFRSADPISDGGRYADAMARAVGESALPHLVLLSSIATRHAEGTGLCLTLRAAETRLADSPARITFLRASYFLDNWLPVLGATAAGKLPTFIRPDLAIQMVATRDIGAAAARALLEGPPSARDVVELAGPRDCSAADLATTLARLLGRPVEPEPLPLQAVVPVFTGLGASPAFAEQVQQMYQAVNEGRLTGQGAGVRTLRGSVDPEVFFRQALGQEKAA